MNNSLYRPIPLLAIIACGHSAEHDERRDWELYEPIVDASHDLMQGELTWSAVDVPSALHDSIPSVGAEWSHVLECGLTLREVDPTVERPDVIFSCGEVAGAATPDVDSLSATRGPNGSLVVTVSVAQCQSPQTMLARHALGHALGLVDDVRWYQTTMGTMDLATGTPDSGFSPMEIDGFRIWAHERGAPGCGKDELQWSWIESPEAYHEHPSDPPFTLD